MSLIPGRTPRKPRIVPVGPPPLTVIDVVTIERHVGMPWRDRSKMNQMKVGNQVKRVTRLSAGVASPVGICRAAANR